MNRSYEELLEWAYLGEVWGERMLTRLLELGTFGVERDHLRVLLALESQTRRSLESLVTQTGLDVELDATLEQADQYADELAGTGDWDTFMKETQAIATSALPEFERLRGLCPAGAVRALTETVEHELAVIDYSSLRLQGRPDDAVAAVSRHLSAWSGPSICQALP